MEIAPPAAAWGNAQRTASVQNSEGALDSSSGENMTPTEDGQRCTGLRQPWRRWVGYDAWDGERWIEGDFYSSGCANG